MSRMQDDSSKDSEPEDILVCWGEMMHSASDSDSE